MKPFVLQRWPVDLPFVALGEWPTPIRRLPLDLPGAVWLKDEGCAGTVYGGNKVRKLELILGDALARDAGDLVTIGAVGSHHVVAVAAYARSLGLRTHALVFPQPDTPHVRDNARLIDALCERWDAVDALWKVPLGWTRLWGSVAAMSGRRPYVVGPGGSDPLGTVGWLGAGLEIAAALEGGTLPRLDRVVAAVGSGGTLAGLLAGLRIAGVDAEVVGVRVVDRVACNEARVRRIARAAVRRLQVAGADVTMPELGGLRLEHGWFGDGYGSADARVTAAIADAAALGLSLDQTYTGRAFGACIAGVGEGEHVLFVNTVNARPLDALLAEALPDVPDALRPLLA